MIPASDLFDQSIITALLDHDPVVLCYRTLFALFDWTIVDAWQAQRSDRGRPGHPISAYLKAFLVRLNEGITTASQLRRFLIKHPLLVIDLGFDLELDPSATYGINCEKTIPTDVWLRARLRTLDPDLLRSLLSATVTALQQEIPGVGDVVAFDVKHIYAWVKENNPRVYVKERYDKTRQPAGDPDCRLGVKRSTNQQQADGSIKEKKEYIWGYGSGVAAATTPDYGDVVIAEYTQPFNETDVTYYRPLYERTVLALHRFPMHTTADAAFDAWYVYDDMARHGGIAAVPLNQHGKRVYAEDDGTWPLCEKGLKMHPTYQFDHSYGYRAQFYRCPLFFPTKQEQATCDNPRFSSAKGCTKHVNVEAGGLQRISLDRDGPLYKAVYTQRTSCERINSQAKELGIERPKVRNIRSVRNLNTLTYLLINVRALERAKSINKGILHMN